MKSARALAGRSARILTRSRAARTSDGGAWSGCEYRAWTVKERSALCAGVKFGGWNWMNRSTMRATNEGDRSAWLAKSRRESMLRKVGKFVERMASATKWSDTGQRERPRSSGEGGLRRTFGLQVSPRSKLERESQDGLFQSV